MGLINSISSANRVVDTALCVTYSRKLVYGSWTHVSLNVTTVYNRAWELSRHAVKNYRYVGLTEAAAKNAISTLKALYRRSVKISEWDGQNGEFDDIAAGEVIMVSIVAQHEDGEMWSVVVSVDEVDTRMRLAAVAPESVFATEKARSYDGETEAS